MKKIGRLLRVSGSVAAILLVVAAFISVAQAKDLTGTKSNISLRIEAEHAMQRGFDFLKKNQAPDGSWSNPDFPALTGLATVAFLRSPDLKDAVSGKAGLPDHVKKALAFILSNAKENGAIYKEGLPNYNTSICMMALALANDPQYHAVLLKGRRFLATLQKDDGIIGVADQPLDGGIGYGSKDHSDMSNTVMALESLRMTEFLESDQHLARFQELKGLQKTTLNWDAAIHFIERCQNLPGSNDQAWASDDPKNKGGFVYFPGNSKAGEETLADGRTALRSYGSMTYAGLLSFIFADVKKDDPRVTAAYDWLKRNYTLEENPGMGGQGLFYYYHTMAKALTVMGDNALATADGKNVDWRKELTIRLLNLQKGDGSWVNDTARWWESDPVLVTAYSLIALDLIVPQI